MANSRDNQLLKKFISKLESKNQLLIDTFWEDNSPELQKAISQLGNKATIDLVSQVKYYSSREFFQKYLQFLASDFENKGKDFMGGESVDNQRVNHKRKAEDELRDSLEFKRQRVKEVMTSDDADSHESSTHSLPVTPHHSENFPMQGVEVEANNSTLEFPEDDFYDVNDMQFPLVDDIVVNDMQFQLVDDIVVNDELNCNENESADVFPEPQLGPLKRQSSFSSSFLLFGNLKPIPEQQPWEKEHISPFAYWQRWVGH